LSAPIVSLPLAIVWMLAQALAVGLGVAGATEAAVDGTALGAAVGAAVGTAEAALPVQAASSRADKMAKLNKAGRRMAGSLIEG
jgi:hypothetical protein